MNRVLSLLVVYIFLQTQSWALSGGPVFSGSQQSLVGTYAGVIIPTLVPISTTTTTTTEQFGANSLGIFSIGVPATDLAQGAVALFFEGSFFQGGLLGVADPGKSELFAIGQLVRGVSKTVNTGTAGGTGGSISLTFDATADGTIHADIEATNQFAIRMSGEGTFALKVLNLTTLAFEPQGEIQVEIEGFQQSTDVVIPDANSTAGLLNQ